MLGFKEVILDIKSLEEYLKLKKAPISLTPESLL